MSVKKNLLMKDAITLIKPRPYWKVETCHNPETLSPYWYTRCFRINSAKPSSYKMKTNWWFIMRFSVSYAEINRVLLFEIRFLIISQTMQLFAVLGGDPKTAIYWQWKCDMFAFLFDIKNVKNDKSCYAMIWKCH